MQGALMIDIGGGTTDFILMYVDGAVKASGCIGIGGDHMATNDISMGLRIPMARAREKTLKVEEGSVTLGNVRCPARR